MELTKKERTIKYVCYCLLIGLGALLQNVGGLWLEIGNARCFFLIPIAILLGIDEDERVAGLLGLFAGVLWDSVGGQTRGFNAIFIMVASFVISSLATYLLVSTFWVKVACCFVVEFIYVLLYWMIFVLSKGGDGASASFGYFYLPCFVYTAVATLVLIPLIKLATDRLNKEPNME